jgi:predicted amidophosphoribosyltransferase
MDTSVLKRCRKTQSQTGLTRHQRRENVRGAFGEEKLDAIKGRGILLVDDVFTTGTTVSEYGRTLLRAGASNVFVAQLRALARPPLKPFRSKTFARWQLQGNR